MNATTITRVTHKLCKNVFYILFLVICMYNNGNNNHNCKETKCVFLTKISLLFLRALLFSSLIYGHVQLVDLTAVAASSFGHVEGLLGKAVDHEPRYINIWIFRSSQFEIKDKTLFLLRDHIIFYHIMYKISHLSFDIGRMSSFK